MIVVIEDMEGFKSLETEWNDLYSDNDFLPFQSYEYNFISWNDMLNNQQNSLFIICYYEENAKQIGAIFPLYVDIRKCLRFINDSHTDFQTALIRKKLRSSYSMFEEIFMYLYYKPKFNRFFLDNMMNDDPLLPYFGHFNRNVKIYRTKDYSIFEVKQHPEDKSYIDSLRHLTAKERNRLKNISKKMINVEFRILNITRGNEYPEDVINAISQAMIKNGIRSKSYFTCSMYNFIRDLYNKGLLNVALIYDKGEVCSASLFYICHENKYLIQWIILYTDKKYNLWSKLKILECFYNQGGGIFNFGRGAYPYKIQHFKPQISNLLCLDLSKSDSLRYRIQVKDNFELLSSIVKRFIHNKICAIHK